MSCRACGAQADCACPDLRRAGVLPPGRWPYRDHRTMAEVIADEREAEAA